MYNQISHDFNPLCAFFAQQRWYIKWHSLHYITAALNRERKKPRPIKSMRSIVFMIAAFQFVIFVMACVWSSILRRAIFLNIYVSCSCFYVPVARCSKAYTYFLSLSLRIKLVCLKMVAGSRCMTLDGFYGQLFCQRVIRNGMEKFIVVFVSVLLLIEFSRWQKWATKTMKFAFRSRLIFVFLLVFHFHLIFAVMSIQQQNHFASITKQYTKKKCRTFPHDFIPMGSLHNLKCLKMLCLWALKHSYP